jgi:ABC-type Mn2+/Zn2+ transport system ATPase subunit
MSGPLLTARGLEVAFGRRVVLRDVDFDLPRGGFVGLIGPNGGGKTTLLRALLGLKRPRRGRIEREPGLRVGWVQQRQHLDPLWPLSARELVLQGRLRFLRPGRRPTARDVRAVDEALATVGLQEHASRLFRELSGGQSQRCLLARALASEPDLLVLDEPTNDLDLVAEERVLHLIEQVRRERDLSVLLVTHLLHVVLNHADHLALLRDGRLRQGPVEELATSEALGEFFGGRVDVERVDGRLVVSACPPETPDA